MKPIPDLRSPRVPVVVDYGLYSLTNFVLGVAVARAASLAIYGVYALLFQLGNFSLVMIRATIGEAWLVTERAKGGSPEAKAVPTGYAFALGIGLVPPFLVVTALLADVENHWGLVLAMTLVLPALLAQDTHRFVCFASRQPWRAVRSDASWLAAQIFLLAFMAIDIVPFSPGWAASAWAVGAYVALFTVGGARHLQPSAIAAGFRWWRGHLGVGRHLALETVGSSMVGPLVAVGLVMMGQQITLGVLRGASTLFSPVLVFAQGMRTALTKGANGDQSQAMRGARVLLMTTALVWGGVLAIAPGVGQIILGGLWGPSIHQIVLLEAGARIGLASAAVDSAQLRRRSQTRAAATVGLWSGGFVVALALLGASVADSFGAALGAATAYALGAGTWRYVCRREHPALMRV